MGYKIVKMNYVEIKDVLQAVEELKKRETKFTAPSWQKIAYTEKSLRRHNEEVARYRNKIISKFGKPVKKDIRGNVISWDLGENQTQVNHLLTKFLETKIAVHVFGMDLAEFELLGEIPGHIGLTEFIEAVTDCEEGNELLAEQVDKLNYETLKGLYDPDKE